MRRRTFFESQSPDQATANGLRTVSCVVLAARVVPNCHLLSRACFRRRSARPHRSLRPWGPLSTGSCIAHTTRPARLARLRTFAESGCAQRGLRPSTARSLLLVLRCTRTQALACERGTGRGDRGCGRTSCVLDHHRLPRIVRRPAPSPTQTLHKTSRIAGNVCACVALTAQSEPPPPRPGSPGSGSASPP